MDDCPCRGIPTMTEHDVHRFLCDVGRGWKGKGVALEVGSWLGASTAALLSGLVASGYNRPLFAFDRWTANGSEVAKGRSMGTTLTDGQDLSVQFLANVSEVYPRVDAVRGAAHKTLRRWKAEPVEICIVDGPKRGPEMQAVMGYLLPAWIPKVTVVGLLDYGWRRNPKAAPAFHEFVADMGSKLVLLKEWPGKEGAFFRYEG